MPIFPGDATGDEMDEFGHGTQVASTVAMCTPDNVKIEGFKVSNNQIITDSSVLLALSHIKEMNRKPDVINMSFSGTEMDSHIETEINELTDMGIVFVGSAGNNGREVKSYPAAYDNVIAVAANPIKTTNPCDFSNFGNYVDIAAPGIILLIPQLPAAMHPITLTIRALRILHLLLHLLRLLFFPSTGDILLSRLKAN